MKAERLKRKWYYFVSIFAFTEKARINARKKLIKPLFRHPTGVCLGCGVDMYDGTDFCCDDCANFYAADMESYGRQ
jgi:hypothetical protein